jgi:ATP-dependent RNA helicase SUPV3L1/SUV3
LGVRLGAVRLYLPALLKPAAVAMRALLFAVHHGLSLPVSVPAASRISVTPEPGLPAAFYAAIGFPVAGPRAIRADILDRFEIALKSGTAPAGRTLGCPEPELPLILAALGYQRREQADGPPQWRLKRQHRARPVQSPPRPVDDDHPFALLRARERSR